MAAVSIPASKIIILSVYRSPLGCYQTFKTLVNSTMEYLFETYDDYEIVMTGDFNINFSGNSVEREQLVNSLASFGMTPVFNETSRAGKTSNTCIDNIFIHKQRAVDEAKTLNANISDHFAQMIQIPVAKSTQKPTTRRIRVVNSWRLIEFIQSAKETNWEQFAEYTEFHTTLCNLINESFPLKEIKTCQAKKTYGRNKST